MQEQRRFYLRLLCYSAATGFTGMLWELLAPVLPFCIWLVLQSVWPAPSSAKGLGNLTIEPVYFAMAVPGAALVRVIAGVGRLADERGLAGILLAALCVVAAPVLFSTPNLGGSFGCSP